MSTFKTNGAPGQARRRRSAAGGPILSPPPPEFDALSAAVDRVAADLRALATMARSVALPPAGRLDEIERLAYAHIEELRARLAAQSGAVTVERVGLS